MKKIILIILLSLPFIVKGQVGINVNEPVATLDINARPTNSEVPDGLTVPRLTLLDLYNKGEYSPEQTSAIVYITDPTLAIGTVPNSLKFIIEEGFYVFDGIRWNSLEAKAGSVTFIGVKPYYITGQYSNYTNNGVMFTKIKFNTSLNVGGGKWDDANLCYEIPVTGNYLINFTFRATDNNVNSYRFYISVSDVIEENSEGVWFTGNVQRTGYSYNKLVYYTKGTKIYAYFRTPNNIISPQNLLLGASLNVMLLNSEV